MCFVFISEQTASFALYNINWVVFIKEMKSVRTGFLNKSLPFVFKRLICVLVKLGAFPDQMIILVLYLLMIFEQE
jgi:hypothetical protein